jgi:hypothetical protein
MLYYFITPKDYFLTCLSNLTLTLQHHPDGTKTTRLGGAYPGQRRPQHAPYVPPASDFNGDGTATVHFVAYGGGNALTLVQSDGTTKPLMGQAQPEYVEGKE